MEPCYLVTPQRIHSVHSPQYFGFLPTNSTLVAGILASLGSLAEGPVSGQARVKGLLHGAEEGKTFECMKLQSENSPLWVEVNASFLSPNLFQVVSVVQTKVFSLSSNKTYTYTITK